MFQVTTVTGAIETYVYPDNTRLWKIPTGCSAGKWVGQMSDLRSFYFNPKFDGEWGSDIRLFDTFEELFAQLPPGYEKPAKYSEPAASRSQCQVFGAPAPQTWEDYRKNCEMTYGGGYHDPTELEIFRHGMATVFNLLHGEFPAPQEIRKNAKFVESFWDEYRVLSPKGD